MGLVVVSTLNFLGRDFRRRGFVWGSLGGEDIFRYRGIAEAIKERGSKNIVDFFESLIAEP